MVINVYSPLRIDIFGNWSDHLSILSYRPSRVVNMAFCLSPNRFPIHIKISKLKQAIVRYRSIDLREERLLSFEEIANTPVLNGILEYYPSSTPQEFDEHLKKKGGLEVITNSCVPLQSGLGTSSALTTSIILALWSIEERAYTIDELAERAYVMERKVSNCGWQDHYASAYGRAVMIERHSSSCKPSITFLPRQFSELLFQYGSLIFVSNDQHPEVYWNVEGNEDIICEMDEVISYFIKLLPIITLERLQELIRLSWSLSRTFFPHDFCRRLDSILELVDERCSCGFLTGLGPAAVLISPEPDALRAFLNREKICTYPLYSSSSGTVAFPKPIVG